MKWHIWPERALLFLCLFLSLLNGPSALAQEPGRELDKLAKRIGKELTKAGISSVVVADFVSRGGTDSVQGRYLADELSQRLDRYKKRFVVIDRKQISVILAGEQLSAKDVATEDFFRRIGNALHADAVVMGTLVATPSEYSVHVTARSVRDGSLVASGDESVKRPAYVDRLALLDPTGSIQNTARAGVDGVSVPSCVTRPAPKFAERDEVARASGRAIMLVVVTSEGRAGGIAVVEASNDGLAKKAVETVTGWKFKPAIDKEGNPVPVIIPIEITINSY
ncbi:MAG: TonB family protein [Candidatus Acidiferrales bacterium]